MPAVRHGDPSTANAGTTRFAIVAKRLEFIQVINETMGLAEWVSTDHTPYQPTGFGFIGGVGTITGTVYDFKNDPLIVSYQIWYRLIASSSWSLGPVTPMEFDGTTAFEITNLDPGLYYAMVIAVNGDWEAKPYPVSPPFVIVS